MKPERRRRVKGKQQDGKGRKPRSAWPRDVMVAAAAMVVDQGVAASQVSAELKIPYTTVAEWAKKYRAGGRAALEQLPGRGGR
jgi:transposase-like protein